MTLHFVSYNKINYLAVTYQSRVNYAVAFLICSGDKLSASYLTSSVTFFISHQERVMQKVLPTPSKPIGEQENTLHRSLDVTFNEDLKVTKKKWYGECE